MEAAVRLFDIPAEEWDDGFRRAVADVYVRETTRNHAQRVVSGERLLTLRDMVWDIAFTGDPMVIPALLVSPSPPTVRALYELGEPAFRATLDMVSSFSPGQFAEDRGYVVNSDMYGIGVNAGGVRSLRRRGRV